MISSVFFAVLVTLSPLPSAEIHRPQSKPHIASSADLSEASKLSSEVVELFRIGKYQEALPLAKRVVQIREKLFSPKDALLRNAWRNLAEVYMGLRKYSDADPLFELLINSYQEFTPDDPVLIELLQRMALLKYARMDQGKAEQLYVQSVTVAERLFGVDSPKVAEALSLLGQLYQAKRQYDKAKPVYQRIIANLERESTTGISSSLRDALDRYSCLLRQMGKEDEAITAEMRAVSAQLKPTAGQEPIGGGVLNGKAITLPRPVYPEEARAARARGTVVVQVVIDETGKVIHACAIKGPSELTRVSEVAAYAAVFSPTKVSGQPVRVKGLIHYNYVIR